jgi:hypothetical protein
MVVIGDSFLAYVFVFTYILLLVTIKTENPCVKRQFVGIKKNGNKTVESVSTPYAFEEKNGRDVSFAFRKKNKTGDVGVDVDRLDD